MVVTDGNKVNFSFFRPQAGQVYVVGDFNGWREQAMPMARTADGHWRLRVVLPEGRFRFRYRADEEWFTDYAAFGLEPGPFGDNSIVQVHGRPPA